MIKYLDGMWRSIVVSSIFDKITNFLISNFKGFIRRKAFGGKYSL